LPYRQPTTDQAVPYTSTIAPAARPISPELPFANSAWNAITSAMKPSRPVTIRL
jgi:hypothetical protein